MNLINNKFIHGALPALLLHVCIGTVYCWSLLKDAIANAMSVSVSSIEFAFSLAIFFLGMSAAFGGSIVERNVRKSGLISTGCFVIGLIGTIISIYLRSIPLLFIFYGCLMGIGLGLGYLTPVKTLMLWFEKNKGLATGIAISGFGLAKVLFSPLIVYLINKYDIYTCLYVMSGISVLSMSIASLLIKKPTWWLEVHKKSNIKESILNNIRTILNPTYIYIWIIFYINITCGLAIISFEKSIASINNITWIGTLAAITAIFNTIGRFGYSTASDYIKKYDKSIIYSIITFSSFIIALLCGMFGIFNIDNAISLLIPTLLLLFIINMGYGGGFSTLPIILQSKFGMKNISTIHGLCLSAWAWAGLSGNQLTNLVINYYNGTFCHVYIIIAILYLVAFMLTLALSKRE